MSACLVGGWDRGGVQYWASAVFIVFLVYHFLPLSLVISMLRSFMNSAIASSSCFVKTSSFLPNALRVGVPRMVTPTFRLHSSNCNSVTLDEIHQRRRKGYPRITGEGISPDLQGLLKNNRAWADDVEAEAPGAFLVGNRG